MTTSETKKSPIDRGAVPITSNRMDSVKFGPLNAHSFGESESVVVMHYPFASAFYNQRKVGLLVG